MYVLVCFTKIFLTVLLCVNVYNVGLGYHYVVTFYIS